MSLTSEQRRVQYALGSVPMTLSVPFKFFDATDLKLTRTVAGVDTVLTYGVDYSVTGGGVPCASGSVTVSTGSIGDTITIEGAASQTQDTDLTTGGPLPASTLTAQVDRATMLAQQLKLQTDRSLRLPNSADAISPLDLTLRKGKVLAFDSLGAPTFLDPSGTVLATGAHLEVSNIAAMLGLDVTTLVDKQQIMVAGYYNAGDGGGGLFYYDAGSSTTSDAGLVFTPGVGSGRFKRVYRTGYIDAKYFGVKANGSDDDAALINAALTSAGNLGGAKVILPAGTIFVGATLTMNKNRVVLCGAGKGTTILTRSGDYGDTILVTGDDTTGTLVTDCVVRDLTIKATALTTSGAHIRFNGTFNCDIESVFLRQGFCGFQFSGATAAAIRDTHVQIDDIYGGSSTNRCFALFNSAAATYAHPSCGDLTVSDFNWRNGNGATVAQYGIMIYSADGIWFSNGHVSGVTSATVCLSASTTVSLATVLFNNIMLDGTATTHNVLFQGSTVRARFIQFSNCDIQGNYLTGKGVTVGVGATFSDVSFFGCRIFAHTLQGVSLLSTSIYRFAFLSCHVENNNTSNTANTDGILIGAGVGSVSVVGGSAGGTDGTTCYQRYGISAESGAGDDILLSGVDCSFNTTAGVNCAATGDNVRVVGCIDGSTSTVASASAIALPLGSELVTVTGTTNIDNITALGRGQRVTLIFTGVLTVKDGTGNLKLAGDFTTTADDTLSLICDGTSWNETGRSVN